jgi:hypothetical protein
MTNTRAELSSFLISFLGSAIYGYDAAWLEALTGVPGFTF